MPMPSVPRILILGALLAGPIAPTPISILGVARAQDAVFDAPVFRALPGPAVHGDGSTPVDVHVVVLGVDGKPLSGVTGRVAASEGSAENIEELAPGLYRIRFTPPRATAATSVDLALRARLPDRTSANPTFAVPVSPRRATTIRTTPNPTQIVLGQDASATLTMNLSGGPAGTELDVRASVGSISNLTHLGGGQFSALYTPPNKPYPHVAVITMADKANPDRVFGTLALPLVGKASFPVSATPNSRVMIRINDRDFGPVQADASGRANVPIVVPPGFSSGTLITIVGDNKTEEPLDLQLPPTPRLELLPTDTTIPADPSLKVPVRVFVVSPTGEPDTTATVKFTTTAGDVSAAKHLSGGVYEATFTPPYGNAASQATITVTVEDPRSPQTSAITLNLSPARPASVSVSAEPPQLGSQTASFQAYAKVIGQNGVGVSGRQPRFFSNGASLSGGVKDLGNGDYQARFSANGEGGAEVAAVVLGDAGRNPLADILVIPARQQLRSDGASATPVTVLSVDRFGYPVPNVTVSLKGTAGGSMPSTITTDGAGVAQFNFTAGRDAGLAEISASSGEVTGGGAVLQLPADAGIASLPITGTAAQVAHYKAWQQAVAYLRIERAGATGVIVAGDVSGRAGPLARIGVTPEPASVAAGGTITLKIRAEDGQGRGKAGQQFDFAATTGTVGTVTDLGGGDYSVPLVVPPDAAAGEAKVTVASSDGTIVGFVKIPVSAPAAVATWGTSEPASEPAAEPATDPEPARVKPPREPREPGEFPWLRAHVGYRGGFYGYNQQPLTATSPLYDQSVTFGGGTSADPASSVGINARARAFLPALEFLGADMSFGTIRYAVTIPAFDEPVVDWVNDFNLQAVGRYPFAVGGGQMHVGARLGGGVDDFIIYKQEVENGQRLLTYEQLVVAALNVGAEAGLDIADLFVVAGVDAGLANGSTYYRLKYHALLGYAFIDNVYAQAGLNVIQRNSELENESGAKIGDLQDQSVLFTAGIGFQL